MIRRLIILLLIVGCLYADVQLVKGDKVVFFNKGKKFSINGYEHDDKTRYKFESIDFDKKIINDSLDINLISSITIYGNNWKKGFKKGFYPIFIPATLWKLTPKAQTGGMDTFYQYAVYTSLSLVSGGIGALIGLYKPDITTYQISDFEWQFKMMKTKYYGFSSAIGVGNRAGLGRISLTKDFKINNNLSFLIHVGTGQTYNSGGAVAGFSGLEKTSLGVSYQTKYNATGIIGTFSLGKRKFTEWWPYPPTPAHIHSHLSINYQKKLNKHLFLLAGIMHGSTYIKDNLDKKCFCIRDYLSKYGQVGKKQYTIPTVSLEIRY